MKRVWLLALSVALLACSSDDNELLDPSKTGTGKGGEAGAEDPGGSGGSPEQVCTPGKQEACACPGGVQGAQACNEEGTGFLACDCEQPSAGGGGLGGSAGAAGGGGSGAGSSGASGQAGGAGAAGEAGSSNCEPFTQEQACAADQCGPANDGCGGYLDCGGCPGWLQCKGPSGSRTCQGLCKEDPSPPVSCAVADKPPFTLAIRCPVEGSGEPDTDRCKYAVNDPGSDDYIFCCQPAP